MCGFCDAAQNPPGWGRWPSTERCEPFLLGEEGPAYLHDVAAALAMGGRGYRDAGTVAQVSIEGGVMQWSDTEGSARLAVHEQFDGVTTTLALATDPAALEEGDGVLAEIADLVRAQLSGGVQSTLSQDRYWIEAWLPRLGASDAVFDRDKKRVVVSWSAARPLAPGQLEALVQSLRERWRDEPVPTFSRALNAPELSKRVDIGVPEGTTFPHEVPFEVDHRIEPGKDSIEILAVHSTLPALSVGARVRVHLRWTLETLPEAWLVLWLSSAWDRRMSHTGGRNYVGVLRGEGEARVETSLFFPAAPHIVLHHQGDYVADVGFGDEACPVDGAKRRELFGPMPRM